ncbi:hypothetical protein [Falsibacillus albus]|uniref:hypothetical protein n=1 Tax=Falsibacillus albus TaxID=2478915 RepID=UPI0011E5E7A6|nr:hypothetical protein [Falsibacillus albus]
MEKPWGWIKAAMFPYNPVLVPKISPSEDPKKSKKLLKLWQNSMEKEKITHISEEIKEKVPVQLKNLKKFGIYPKRGILNIGGEVSYNLFPKITSFDRPEHISYDILKPYVTVYNGEVIYVNDQPIFCSGMGREIFIAKPGYFI